MNYWLSWQQMLQSSPVFFLAIAMATTLPSVYTNQAIKSRPAILLGCCSSGCRHFLLSTVKLCIANYLNRIVDGAPVRLVHQVFVCDICLESYFSLAVLGKQPCYLAGLCSCCWRTRCPNWTESTRSIIHTKC